MDFKYNHWLDLQLKTAREFELDSVGCIHDRPIYIYLLSVNGFLMFLRLVVK